MPGQGEVGVLRALHDNGDDILSQPVMTFAGMTFDHVNDVHEFYKDMLTN
jgi:hypothetical protein